VVLSNDRTLVAYAESGCGHSPHLVATPQTRTVVLAIADPVPGVPACPDRQFVTVETTLSAPLDGRRLVLDGILAPVLTVYQARMAPVSVLPPGYRFESIFPAIDGGDPAPGWTPGDLVATQVYTPAHGDDAPVSVCEATKNGSPVCYTALGFPPGQGETIATLNVRGCQAAYQAEDTGRSLSWTAPGGHIFVVTSWIRSSGQHLLSEAQLLAVARGVLFRSSPAPALFRSRR